VFPWYSAAMLAFEANHVIALRLSKLAFGGAEAHYEAKLMITEKIDAAMEASYNLIRNGDISAVVARYREHVSANANRLSLR
jgi:ribosomal protein S24E